MRIKMNFVWIRKDFLEKYENKNILTCRVKNQVVHFYFKKVDKINMKK